MKLKFNLGLIMAFTNIQGDYQAGMMTFARDSWHLYVEHDNVDPEHQTFSNFDYANMIPTKHDRLYIDDIRSWCYKLELVKL